MAKLPRVRIKKCDRAKFWLKVSHLINETDKKLESGEIPAQQPLD